MIDVKVSQLLIRTYARFFKTFFNPGTHPLSWDHLMKMLSRRWRKRNSPFLAEILDTIFQDTLPRRLKRRLDALRKAQQKH
ncbi:MAG: hypothetical protein Q8L74_16845 [Nitrospirota bacterium]|nr:hypothetical protein [Nitrospirota bacterium]